MMEGLMDRKSEQWMEVVLMSKKWAYNLVNWTSAIELVVSMGKKKELQK
jgi:hypothetical protein